MDLTVTIHDSARGCSADVRLQVDDDQGARELADTLRDVVGGEPDSRLVVDDRVVPEGGRIEDWELVDGSLVELRPAPLEPAGEPASHQVVVVSGPDAGRTVRADGDVLVGRATGCDLQLHDGSVSRRHARLSTTPIATLTDLGSRNGSWLSGERLAAHALTVMPDDAVARLGASALAVRAAAGSRPRNRLVLPRLTTVDPPPTLPDLTVPALPPPPPRPRLPLAALVLPMLVGAGLSLLLRQWQFLAFVALSPLMALGQTCSDRRERSRVITTARRAHEAQRHRVDHDRAGYVEALRRHRHRRYPDLAALTTVARDGGDRLWERGTDHPDWLVLRLGSGELAEVSGQRVPDAAITVSLAEQHWLGVTGDDDVVGGLARSLVVQAATLHPPSALRIVVLAPGRAQRWAWARWLPHARQPDGRASLGLDARQVAARIDELRAGDAATTLVVVDPATTADTAHRLAADLADLSHARVLWLARDRSALPASCVAVVTCHSPTSLQCGEPSGAEHGGEHSDRVADLAPDLVALDVATAAARCLAPYRDRPDDDATSSQRRWMSLVGIASEPGAAADQLARRWQGPASYRIPLGTHRASGDTSAVDLATDGPHALVAGMTGSGKSELLRTLVAGLAVANGPDRLALLLIDYKGGATFGDLAALPQTAAVLTDLDSTTTRRALQSLRAELRRRERLLADAAAVDLAAYDATSGSAPIPRLVIVVDEFATLVDDLPDFVPGLVGIAQRGRSLGVHLVLATQRPQGVVSADIRANTNLRLCLAVARVEDSRDVLDDPRAASLSASTPGRGFLRVGPSEPREFQVVRTGSVRGVPAEPVRVLPVERVGDPLETADTVTGPDDLDLLRAASTAAAHRLGLARAVPPWRPLLPERLELSDLEARTGRRGFALLDLPDRQQQTALAAHDGTADATAGSWLVAGCPRSGRSTTVRSIVTSLAASVSPADLTFWVVSHEGYDDLARLPHCGGVVACDDDDRLDRLLDALALLVTTRRHAHPDTHRRGLLVIDSWESLAASGGPDGRRLDAVTSLLATAAGSGLSMLVTGDRATLTGRVGARLPDKLVLRLADRGDYALVGALRAAELPGEMVPGRALRAGDGAHLQVALPDPVTTQQAMRWPVTTPLVAATTTPSHVSLGSLLPDIGSTTGQLVLGVTVADLSPARLDPDATGGSLLVAGPHRSGRSSVLLTLAGQLHGRATAVVCPRPSPLRALAGSHVLDLHDQHAAVAVLDELSDDSPPHVLVDDLDALSEGPLTTWLEHSLRHTDGQRLVAVSGTTDMLSTAFHGPARVARQHGVGVVLCPESARDGEVLGVRLPSRGVDRRVKGRGWLVVHGETTAVQCALP